MPKPYDATSKMLIEMEPEAWIVCARLIADGPARVLNVDLSTVTSAADYVIQVDADPPWLAHVEFVSSYEKDLVSDIALRNALLYKRYRKAVQSIVILLHPRSFHSELTGVCETFAAGESTLRVSYKLIKAWEFPVSELLAGSFALMPLSVLSAEIKTRSDVPPVLERLHDRLIETLPQQPGLIRELWTAAEVLLGLKFQGEENKAWIKSLTRGVLSVKDSIIYQDILDEGRTVGRAEGVIKTLLKVGKKSLGEPDEGEKVALEAIRDPERLDRMADRLNESSSWSDLLRTE